ncbi:glycosyltransferase family 25 protein [Microdochium nivale]|nr:glycosyltransferase family 25 protein [Microdochium nivale]
MHHQPTLSQLPSAQERPASSLGGVLCIGLVFFVVVCFLLLKSTFQAGHDAHASNFSQPTGSLLADFEDTLVVSLPSRIDRHDGMLLQAALNEVKIKFVDAIMGKAVPDKAIPIITRHGRLSDASIRSWWAHVNAIHEVVTLSLTSALIKEDDIDWDIRIHKRLHDFVLCAQALTQPLAGSTDTYANPTYPHPSQGSPDTVPDIVFGALPRTVPAKTTPYGGDWDVLWLGH